MKMKMNPNVVLPTLLEVLGGVRVFTVAVLVIRGEEEDVQRKPELTCCRNESTSVGDGMVQGPS